MFKHLHGKKQFAAGMVCGSMVHFVVDLSIWSSIAVYLYTHW